jgi:hypothetical protein
MPKVRYHKEGELPEEPEREPKTVLHSDTPSMDEIFELPEEESDPDSADNLEETQEIKVDTANDFGLGLQMSTIRPIAYPQFKTKQQAYRFAAWLINMAELLPDETLDHSFDEVNEAIRNT